MFSSRLPARIEPNALSLAVAAARAEGGRLLDLTETNPTTVDLDYPSGILDALADPAALTYRPEPLGLATARAAVARFAGPDVVPEQVVLTASTSEAYALLFKLLCDPGDEVLVPRPSYPLFELLTGLESVRAVPYFLDRHGAWCLNRRSVEAALTPRTRAILVVSPNNPTGSLIHADDRQWLVALAAERHVAIIADEVFGRYPLMSDDPCVSMAGESDALVFTLDGLSKSAGLPQVKLGWVVVSGPETRVPETMARLEIIADTYLSVSTPVQVAAATLVDAGASVRRQILTRVRLNLETLRQRIAREPSWTLMEPEAGWSAVLRVPAVMSEDALVLRILRDARVLVHPGYFFDFDDEAFLVVSLLSRPDRFEEAVDRMAELVHGILHG